VERQATRKGVVAGCVGALVVLVVVVAAFVAMYRQAHVSIPPVVGEFLGTVERGDYRLAYRMVDEEWKEAQSFEEFRAHLIMINDTLGKRRSLKETGFHFEAYPGTGKRGKVTYDAEFENGPVTLTVTLRRHSGQWRVVDANFGSELFAGGQTCPHCNQISNNAARFCRGCGEPLMSQESAGTAK
jgi:hypothetical protein